MPFKMSSDLKKQENIQKAQVFLQAAHLYQTSKIAKGISGLKKLQTESNEIQKVMSENLSRMNAKLNEQNQILRRKEQQENIERIEKEKIKELKNIFFDIVEELENIKVLKVNNLEKYFKTMSIKAMADKNEISHRITEELEEKNLISQTLRNVQSYSDELISSFDEKENQDFEEIISILEVDEEKEIENISSDNLFQTGEKVIDLHKLIEKTFTEKPYLLLKIFDQKETLKEIRYCLFNDEITHFVSSGKYLPKIDYDKFFIENNQSSEFSGLLSEIGFDLTLTKNIFDFKNFDVGILDKIIVSSKNWYKDFFKVSALNAITLKKVSFEEKNKVFKSIKYFEVGNFLVKVFFNALNETFGPSLEKFVRGSENIKDLKKDIDEEKIRAARIISEYPFVGTILENRK